MKNISLIAAIGKNNELGKNNSLIWSLPGDMKFFRETTINHTIIMGYNTYLSIGKPLPKRRNIVLTSKNININDIVVYHNIDDLLKKEISNDEVFIIGGASIYNSFYSLANKMYLTLIDAEEKDADTYFPNINNDEWKQTLLLENEDNGIKYKHVLFERINNE